MLTKKRDSKEVVPSLIKWTGSKRAQAVAIYKVIPDHKRYYEPFLGSGAILFLAAKPGSIGSDIYLPLIQLWKLIQKKPKDVISDYRDQWNKLQEDLPEYFYVVRERFNKKRNPLDLNFLMRTCVNGIVRFNQDGEFNNSFHLSRKGMDPKRFEEIVNSWSCRIGKVRFECQDYEVTLAEAQKEDFVYLDPPYAGSKNRYVADLNIERFYKSLELLNVRGVKWAWSFDGRRGNADLTHPVPKSIYKRRLLLSNGNSALGKVLNGPVEEVVESLYLNY